MEMAKDAGVNLETKEYVFRALSPVHIKKQISIREIGLETIKDPNSENKYYIIDMNRFIKEVVRQNPGRIDDVEKAIKILNECIRGDDKQNINESQTVKNEIEDIEKKIKNAFKGNPSPMSSIGQAISELQNVKRKTNKKLSKISQKVLNEIKTDIDRLNRAIKKEANINPLILEDISKDIDRLKGKIEDEIKKRKWKSIIDILAEYNLTFNKNDLKSISKGYFIYNDKKGDFISDANGKYYVPGSSIKGAIRTALMWKVLKDTKGNTIDTIVKEILMKKDNHPSDKNDKRNLGVKLEQDVFRSINLSGIENDFVNDIMRCIKVYDCYELSEAMSTENYECVLISTCSDVSKNSGVSSNSEKCYNKNNFPIGTCLHPGQEVKVRISLDKVLLNKFKEKGTVIFDSIEQIMDIVKEFYRTVAAEELEIAKDYNNKCDDQLSLQNIIDFYTKNLNKCTFRLGYGIGAMSTTIRLLISQNTAVMMFGKKGEKVPKSRRFARVKGDETCDSILPFGWMTFE